MLHAADKREKQMIFVGMDMARSIRGHAGGDWDQHRAIELEAAINAIAAIDSVGVRAAGKVGDDVQETTARQEGNRRLRTGERQIDRADRSRASGEVPA